MKTKKARVEMSARLIIGIIFTLIGAIFLALGVILYQTLIDIDIKERIIFLATFGGIGSIFFIIGNIFLILILKKKKESQKLLDSGQYIIAEICDIIPNYNIQVNGTYPYVIQCKYESIDGTVHIFNSRNIFFNPESLLRGTNVKVYTDRKNYKKYYVDIDEMLPKVEYH